MNVQLAHKAANLLMEVAGHFEDVQVRELELRYYPEGSYDRVVLEVKERWTGDKWFRKPSGELLAQTKKDYRITATYKERKDGTFNVAGIVKQIQGIIESIKQDTAANAIYQARRERVFAAFEERDLSRYTGPFQYTASDIDGEPGIQVKFVTRLSNLDVVLEFLEGLGVKVR